MFAVPGESGWQVMDADAECGILVPGGGRGDVLPTGVVEGGLLGPGGIAYEDQPAGIEVVLGAGLRRECGCEL